MVRAGKISAVISIIVGIIVAAGVLWIVWKTGYLPIYAAFAIGFALGEIDKYGPDSIWDALYAGTLSFFFPGVIAAAIVMGLCEAIYDRYVPWMMERKDVKVMLMEKFEDIMAILPAKMHEFEWELLVELPDNVVYNDELLEEIRNEVRKILGDGIHVSFVSAKDWLEIIGEKEKIGKP